MSGHHDKPAKPDVSGMLPLDDGHQMYWEQWGNPDGQPVMYLHGGPGGTLGASGYRHRWDLGRTRLVAFEQRGCGRSTPSAANPLVPLSDFTMAKLISDIERLRRSLGIKQWVLNGVSWGSTLALSYAQAHPERVSGLVLFAVTSTSEAEVRWITETVGAVFPEAWDEFASFAEIHHPSYTRGSGRIVKAYADLLASPDGQLRDAASQAWALWEDTHVSLGRDPVVRDPRWDDARFRQAFARLTTHFWSHAGFNDPPLLERMDRIEHLPGILVHGRQDVSGPLRTAWELHRRWPGSQLVICEHDGHGGEQMTAHWESANNTMLDRLS